ncbi:hypothetical protein GPECTOR_43g949 [Gonium pectorale]|uniref:ATP11 protein n=1 Tax=Gonium pectorale TaxID=33097 RepID=A0A150G9J7_GONPE|nr:hypothetical protein GPECTOR_43g949 [Gonium pectorale]|eukprot:KXZ46512.1 hypothetical protein GPECTOR_43g949 [Gonium pectorale]
MQRARSFFARSAWRCRRGFASEQWSSLRQEAGISGVSAPSPSQLGQVVRLDELLKKTPEEVAEIWLGFHADEKGGRVGSVLAAEEYCKFVSRAKESPMFVLPLAKPSGYETLLVQCQLPYVLITGLEEFKRYGEGAPPYLTLTHYPELLDSHGLAVVRGDIIHEKGMNRQEARTTMELVRAFYTSDEDYSHVHTFNHKPAAFDFGVLLRKLNLAA